MAERVTRIKMRLMRRSEYIYWGASSGAQPEVGFEFGVVTARSEDSEENKKFFAATPSGKMEFGTVNFSAAEGMEVGTEYYVDIIKAD
jgi:hypothetical protein